MHHLVRRTSGPVLAGFPKPSFGVLRSVAVLILGASRACSVKVFNAVYLRALIERWVRERPCISAVIEP